MVSNATVEAEGRIVSAPATRDASGTVLFIGSTLATSYTTAPFNLGSDAAVSLEKSIEDFAADKVKYGNMQNNGDGTVSYTAEPNVEPKPDAFFFKATIAK